MIKAESFFFFKDKSDTVHVLTRKHRLIEQDIVFSVSENAPFLFNLTKNRENYYTFVNVSHYQRWVDFEVKWAAS